MKPYYRKRILSFAVNMSFIILYRKLIQNEKDFFANWNNTTFCLTCEQDFCKKNKNRIYVFLY